MSESKKLELAREIKSLAKSEPVDPFEISRIETEIMLAGIELAELVFAENEKEETVR